MSPKSQPIESDLILANDSDLFEPILMMKPSENRDCGHLFVLLEAVDVFSSAALRRALGLPAPNANEGGRSCNGKPIREEALANGAR